MRQPFLAVETLSFKTPITKHLSDLSVFLPIFTEDKFSLVVIVLILSTSPILSSLFDGTTLSFNDARSFLE